MKEPFKTLAIVSGALLLLATLYLPYGYYSFLRLLIFVSGLIMANEFHKKELPGWMIAFGTIAFVFNPIFPVYLSKELWILIDLIGAGLFFYVAVKKGIS